MPHHPTLRFADPSTARAYPLPVGGEAAWQSRPGGWHLDLPLPELGAGTLIVPSLTSSFLPPSSLATSSGAEGERPPDEAAHQWILHAGGGSWALQAVPGGERTGAPRPGDPVSTHIDCFHVHQRLSGARLHLTLEGTRPPQRYLVCVSTRALTMAEPGVPERAVALERRPPLRSQMEAPQAIARRICSPTCISMVLGHWGREHDWLTVVDECHDPVSGLYGVWPLALTAAARRGCPGAVEAFDGWEEPLRVLERGIPLVTSIRFSAGELPGAPLDETGGHLVVMHAAAPDKVEVCDPAAPDGEVAKSYPASAFSRAWLRHRGAAYILAP